MTEPTTPDDVIGALAAVMRDLGGIEKLTPAQRRARGLSGGGDGERGVTYAFRGVDQIAARTQPLFGQYGVVIVPSRIRSHVETVMLGQPPKPWTDHHVTVKWSIYGPGGIDDVIRAESEGTGRDNADKGPNKAITMAYKNLLLRLLSIGDPADDPDHEKVETDSEPRVTPEQAEAIRAVIGALPQPEQRETLRREVAERWGRASEILARDGETAAEYVRQRVRELLGGVDELVDQTMADDAKRTKPEPTPEAVERSDEYRAALADQGTPLPVKRAAKKAGGRVKAGSAMVEPGPVEPLTPAAEALTEAVEPEAKP